MIKTDVFYPYVKDHIFSSGKTFRQLISLHQTYEGQLAAIEKAAPKLTILVPDFSWLDSNLFCASSWDTSNSFLCVGFDDKQDVHRLYSDGELLGELSASSFPFSFFRVIRQVELLLLGAQHFPSLLKRFCVLIRCILFGIGAGSARRAFLR